MEVVVRGGPEERRYIVRTRAQAARAAVSRQNRQEYDNEKRAKELSRRAPEGPREAVATAVAKMMGIGEGEARRLITRKSKGMVLDGKVD